MPGWSFRLFVFLSLGLAGLCGCESGWEPGMSDAPDHSGLWQGVLRTETDERETGGLLQQEGDHLAGFWDGLAVSGSVEDSLVTLVNGTRQDGAAVTTTLIGRVDGDRMAGTVSFEVDGIEVACGSFSVTRF